MPPVKKNKKQSKAAAASTETASAEPEEQLAISGQIDKKMKKIKSRADRERGVVVIRHLPRGFFEEQLKKYFEQFGTVTRLRLARSTRSGGSKGFAFVEFEYPEVAKVAAQTMDNYLMFQKLVKAQYIPPENQNYNYFKSSVRKVTNKVGRPIYVSGKTAAIQRRTQEHNNWNDETYQKRIGSSIRKLEKLKEKYAHLGIDFDNFTVKPNIQSVDEKAEVKAKKETKDESKEVAEPGSLLLLKKRKQSEDKEDNKSAKKAKGKKVIELKDLLDKSLVEEASSEDEEFIPTGGDQELSTSDEEDYGVAVSEDEDEEEEKKKSKKQSKPQKIDREAELLKRKTNAGRIQKSKKAVKDKSKKPASSAIKDSLKVEAAKDIKKLGQVKQLKKKDFNKSGKKKRIV